MSSLEGEENGSTVDRGTKRKYPTKDTSEGYFMEPIPDVPIKIKAEPVEDAQDEDDQGSIILIKAEPPLDGQDASDTFVSSSSTRNPRDFPNVTPHPSPSTGGTSASPTVPKKFTYAERRTAASTLRSHSRSKITTPSAAWMEKVEWARTVLPNYGLPVPSLGNTQPQKEPPALAKRNASTEVIIGLIDEGNPEGEIPKNKWKAVEGQLAIQCLQMLRDVPGSSPNCRDIGWYQGRVKLVLCESQRSADLYKRAVGQLGEVYGGAKIVALDWGNVPRKPVGTVWVPLSIKTPEDILFMIQQCNPSLPTHDWKVIKVRKDGNENRAIVVLNDQSVAPIKAANGVLNFGFCAIKMDLRNPNSYTDDEFEGPLTISEIFEFF